MGRGGAQSGAGAGPRAARPLLALALCLAVFTAAAFSLYAPALRGGFVSDDVGYVLNNPYVHELGAASLRVLLDPFGDAATFTANYAPVHLLAHALEWRAFGMDTLGYHAVNVALHALGATLLVALYASSGIPPTAAALLGALFLVHPANVEAVAWIFQLKTLLALVLSLGALLALPRRPLLASALFALALLSKIAAAYALPVAALRCWARRESSPRIWLALGGWAVALGLCAVPEFAAFERLGHAPELGRYPDTLTHARSIAALAGRYLVMAATSLGVSAFHEPPAALSPGDPWWLAGAALLALLGVRALGALRRRSEEAAYWAWAAVSFAPVSQVFPFVYPMADRYLYLILPGLLGGAFFAGRDALAGAQRRLGPAASRAGRLAGPAALAVGLALAALFAGHSARRTPIWRGEALVIVDAALRYPDGRSAQFLRARRAAQGGDAPAAAAALERLADQGYDGFLAIQADPGLAPLHGEPGYQAALARIADNWIRQARGRALIQPEQRMLGLAHLARGDEQAALAALRRALAQGGPLDPTLRAEIAALEAGRGR